MEVGNGIAGSRGMILDRRLVIRTSLRNNDDVVQLRIAVPCFLLPDQDLRRYAVPRMKFTGNAGVLELVRHGHGFHEAGNVFAVKRDVGAIEADDVAANGKRLLREFARSRGRRRMTTCQKKDDE